MSSSNADIIVVLGSQASTVEKPARAQRARRVDQACENCRRKRLKCTAEQHPCMNCLLYHAECVYTRNPKPQASNGITKPQSRTRKRKRSPAEKSVPSKDTGGEQAAQSPGEQSATENTLSVPTGVEPRQSKEPASGGIQHEGMGMQLQQHAEEAAQLDADPLGDLRMSEINDDAMAMNIGDFNGMPDFLDDVPLTDPHPSNPSPELQDNEDNGSVIGLQHLIRKSSTSMSPGTKGTHSIPPGLVIKTKDDSSRKFIGANSTGATVAGSLRCSIVDHHGCLDECDVQNYLIGAVVHVDEMGVPLSTLHSEYKLPDQATARRGVDCYFRNINDQYPILNGQKFLNDWPCLYDAAPPDHNPVLYSRFFLVVAIGLLSQNPTPALDSSLDVLSKLLHQQAWHLINDVVARPYASSVQVILLHVMYLIHFSKSGMAWVLCGLAIRIAQSVGLHRQPSLEMNLSDEMLRLRSQIWWVCYRLDASLSATQGRPPAISNALCDVELMPLLRNPDSPDKKLVTYYWHIKLAQIENSYCSLCSSVETAESRADKVGHLDTALRKWRDEIPMEYRPDQEILADREMYQSIAMMHLQYYNVLRSLHWASLSSAEHYGYSLSLHSNPRVRSSEAICVASARSFVKILNDMSDELDVPLIPLCFHTDHYMAALSSIFQNIFKYPQKHSARTDLEILRAGQYHFERHVHPSRLNPQLGSLFRKMQAAAEDLLNQKSSSARSHPGVTNTDKPSDSGFHQPNYGPEQSPGMSFFNSMFSPRFSNFGQDYTGSLHDEISL